MRYPIGGRLLIALALAAALLAPGATQAATDDRLDGGGAGRWWTVALGGEAACADGAARQSQRLYPASITIGAGDTVEWRVAAAGPHTVTFPADDETSPALLALAEDERGDRLRPNPLATLPQGGAAHDGTGLTGSGRLGAGGGTPPVYRLAFPRPGAYLYADLFQGQAGTVVVLPANERMPMSRAQINAATAAQLAADTAALACR